MFGEDNCYVMRLNRIDWEMGQGSNIGKDNNILSSPIP